MKRPDAPRPPIIGADSGPEKPFPLKMGGKVVSGFGRGSKELGIPTANIPVEGVPWIDEAKSGVYFGWAGIQLPASHPDLASSSPSSSSSTTDAHSSSPSTSTPAPQPKPSTTLPDAPATTLTCPISPPASHLAQGWRLFPMVMSIGYNPFYKNTVRSAEVHVLHGFREDFYGCECRVLLMGFIREEYDYESLEGLVDDIKEDIRVSERSLERSGWGPVEGEGQGGYLWGEE